MPSQPGKRPRSIVEAVLEHFREGPGKRALDDALDDLERAGRRPPKRAELKRLPPPPPKRRHPASGKRKAR